MKNIHQTFTPPNRRDDLHTINLYRLLFKALLLYGLFSLAFAAFYPMKALGRLSLYNLLFPGRLRLPYGDDPSKAYNLSLYNLEAMFASHEISSPIKSKEEFRLILLGDSSVWGFLLPPQKTLSAQINDLHIQLPDGRIVRAYNLGYPVMSLTKDLYILSYALRYKPDLILWSVTLESFPMDKQLYSPLLLNNPDEVRALIETYHLNIDPTQEDFAKLDFWHRTIPGARRSLADLLRLQLYGVLWAGTGIDHYIPESYALRQEDLEADLSFHDFQPPYLDPSQLALDVLSAGVEMARDIPIIFVNEPIFISKGKNSHIRYNFFYPRWAYDEYRKIMYTQSQIHGWNYLDLWNIVDGEEFTNTAIHLSERGTSLYALKLTEALLKWFSTEGDAK